MNPIKMSIMDFMQTVLIVLAFVVVASSVTLCILSVNKKRYTVPEADATHYSEEELIKNIIEYAKTLKNCEKGRKISVAPLYGTVKKCYRAVERKRDKELPLSESERWLSDNFYLVHKEIFGGNCELADLPSVNDAPRMLLLARKTVVGSLGALTPERVERVLSVVKDILPLQYGEVAAWNDCMKFALLEQIYILCKRLLYREKCIGCANKGKTTARLLRSDMFLYYYLQNKNVSMATKASLFRSGINEESLYLSYNESMLKNTRMAQTYFTALHTVKNFLPPQKAFPLLSSYQKIAALGSVPYCSDGTIASYLRIISKVAAQMGVGEEYAAQVLVRLAIENKTDISVILYNGLRQYKKAIRSGRCLGLRIKEKKVKEGCYVIATVLLTVGATVAAYFVTKSALIACLSAVPLFMTAQRIVNQILTRFPGHPVPKMKYEHISGENATAVVMNGYCSSVDKLKKFIRRMETLIETNRDENISFVLSIDTPASEKQISDADKAIAEYLEKTDTDERLSVYLRKKKAQKNRFVPYERKRGATLALMKCFLEKDTRDFAYIKNECTKKIKYIVALDTDSMILPGGVRDMVNTAIHPYHASYDILSATNRINLYSVRSRYAERFLPYAGYTGYPYYNGFFYRLFDRDIFCGKGIIRLDSFYGKNADAFPNGKILSHDILEGSVCKTGVGGVVFESAPLGFVADKERSKRWKRGDLQLFPFLFGFWKNGNKERVHRAIPLLNGFVIFGNALSVLEKPLLTALFLWGIFGNIAALIAAAALFVLPYAVDAVAVWYGVSGRRLRSTLRQTGRLLVRMTEEFFTLGYQGVSDTFLLLTTVVKSILGMNLLQWKTFSDSEESMTGVIREFIFPITVLLAITAVGVFFAPYVLYLDGYLFLSIETFGWLGYLSVTDRKKNPSPEIKKKMLAYADATYRYFRYVRKEKEPICDNLQVKPYKGCNRTTSPTNIGFGLLAEICAQKLGVIGYEECRENVYGMLKTVMRLPKRDGLLYNWYHTNGKPVGAYISSVDCGNFLAALYVIKNFFRSADKEIFRICSDLIAETDLKRLFDDNKKLFYIGIDGDKKEGHYDYLISESRILDTLYIMRYGDIDHYFCLERIFASGKENYVKSWNGTAFEALLPELFFHASEYSLLGTTQRENVRGQKRFVKYGLWGLSESGEYTFDEEMRYGYGENGLASMGANGTVEQRAFSPYACFLALSEAPEKAVDNLNRFDKIGMYGEYGFYESADIRKGIRKVEQYMTHHQGMILCAIVNYIEDGFLRKLFLKEAALPSVLLLWNEKPSEEYYPSRRERTVKKHSEIGYRGYAETEGIFSVVLGNETFQSVHNANGTGFTSFEKISLGVRKDYTRPHGAFFYSFERDGWHSPAAVLKEDECKFFYSQNEVIYKNVPYDLTQSVTVLPGIGSEVYSFRTGGCRKIAFYSDCVLNKEEDYRAHPTFSDMFVCAKADENRLVVFRRNRSYAVGIRVDGVKNLQWECHRGNFIGGTRTLTDPIFSERKEYPSVGDVTAPCIAFYGETEGVCRVVSVMGRNRKEVENLLLSLPITDIYYYAKQCSERTFFSEKTQETAGAVLYGQYRADRTEKLWAKGELRKTVPHKKVLLYRPTACDAEEFLRLLNVVAELKRVDGAVYLNVSLPSEDGKTEEHWKKLATQRGIEADFGDEKEPFLVFGDGLKAEVLPDTETYSLPKTERSENEINLPPALFRSGCGGFEADGKYIVYNGGEPPYLPYSDIVCGAEGGTVRTENGGGFFFFGNAKENKWVRFDNDFIEDGNGETFLLRADEGWHKIGGDCGKNTFCRMAQGEISFYSVFSDVSVKTVFSSALDGRVRVADISVVNGLKKYCLFLYTLFPDTVRNGSCVSIATRQEDNFFSVLNVNTRKKLYIKVLKQTEEPCRLLRNGCPTEIALEFFDTEHIRMLFSEDKSLLLSIDEEKAVFWTKEFVSSFAEAKGMTVRSAVKSFDLLSSWLPYQILSSRVYGRTGFYQVGGAYGFRDQLQDCMALFAKPDLLKEQIRLSCMHQYKEGDVMHWWHPPFFGVRTRVSDDKLFLPWAVARYVALTEDKNFLDEPLSYVVSMPLAPDEKDRCENPPLTEEKDAVFVHCLKAIRSALKYGEHRLLIMGAGDWNDGMNKICAKGKGESVLTSVFAVWVIGEFAPLCPNNLKKELLGIANELKICINRYAFDENRYLRLYSDEGAWMGGEKSEIGLDLCLQSMAVLSGVADGERAEKVLGLCRERLTKDGIVRLLDAPIVQSKVGYIADYPSGMRENGGQYTHAAVWFLWALLKVGRKEEAFELFQKMNPIEKCIDIEGNKRYKGEPFVLPSDVYAHLDYYGQCGWSWYTGSAGWAYRLIYEGFFGIKVRGKKLYFEPNLPDKLLSSVITITFNGAEYNVDYRKGILSRILLNGEEREYVEAEEGKKGNITVEIGI